MSLQGGVNNLQTALWITICFILIVWSSLVSANEVLSIDRKTSHLELGKHLYYFAETSPLTLGDVLSADTQARFQPIHQEKPNLGFVEGGYWFRLRLKNDQDPEDGLTNWLIELDYPFLDHIEYYPPLNGDSYNQIITGDDYPFDVRDFNMHSYLFTLRLPPGTQRDIYFRVETSTSLQMPLELWAANDFIEASARQQYWLGAFYGIMLVMILYNFFVYLSVRERAYLHYIGYMAGIATVNMIISGVAFQRLWPAYPQLANISFALFAPLTFMFALSFTRSFLQTKQYYGAFDKVLLLLFAVSTIALSFPWLLGQHLSTIISVFLPIPVCIGIFATGIYGMMLKQRRAYFFMAGWSFLIVGFIARSLLQFDLIPHSFAAEYGVQLGATFEVILLSLALADRINREKADRIYAVEASLDAISRQRETEQALAFQSLHDPLTGSPNRLLCQQRIQETLASSNPSDSKVVVCTIHLNNFNDINFTLGHQASDQILIEAIGNLNQKLAKWPGIQPLNQPDRDPVYISIIEGVYLAFVLTCKPTDNETGMVQSLTKELSRPIHFNDMTLDLGGQIGMAYWPQDDLTAEGLIRKSMIAVRAAKWSKMSAVTYDVNIDQYSESRLSLMGELLNAIESDELVLHYQPKIELHTQKITSLEALVRWHHPTRGLLSPYHFIEIAESTGIIQPLTLWVLNASLAYGKRLRQQGLDLSIAVNVSVRNLLNEHFATEVIEALDSHDFPHDKLVLEVVESAVIEDMHQTIQTLEQLKQHGVNLSLDDFGTGYSSLSYLKKLPIHELKIDRSFVTDMITDKDDRVIVETIIAIGRQLKLRVVAEGIEDQETALLLTEMGCDIGQGYWILQPHAGDKLLEWIQDNSQYSVNTITQA